MLGSPAEAEDVVQEAYVLLAIDRLRALKTEREARARVERVVNPDTLGGART
jgi:hypothetical protein